MQATIETIESARNSLPHVLTDKDGFERKTASADVAEALECRGYVVRRTYQAGEWNPTIYVVGNVCFCDRDGFTVWTCEAGHNAHGDHAPHGDLHNYDTGAYLRPATADEQAQCAATGYENVILVDGVSCHVDWSVPYEPPSSQVEVSTEAIEALKVEAGIYGDPEMVAVCNAALEGDEDARMMCAEAIRDGQG